MLKVSDCLYSLCELCDSSFNGNVIVLIQLEFRQQKKNIKVSSISIESLRICQTQITPISDPFYIDTFWLYVFFTI